MDPTSSFSGLNLTLLPGNDWERPDPFEIEDDLDGEQETLLNEPDPKLDADLSVLEETLAGASKGVTEKTDSEYRGCALSVDWLF